MRTKLFRFLLAVPALALFLAAMPAQAQLNPPQRSTAIVAPPVNTCNLNMQLNLIFPPSNAFSASGTGTATFETQSNTQTTSGVATTTQKITSLSGTSTNTTLGTITWSLTTSDDPPPPTTTSTTVTSEPTGTRDYPASVNISFTARATISSLPGKTYRSIGAVTLQGTSNSFNPFTNETVTGTGTINFEDITAPGVVAFSISSIAVTLGPS